jgi:hypothetical protein
MHVESSDPTLINCDFEGNGAVMGAGLYADEGVPDVRGGTFYDNHSSSLGGGVHATQSDIGLIEVTFDSNRGSSGSGAYSCDCSPAFTNCVFLENSCSNTGAGYYADDNSSPTLTGCLFANNTSAFFGGAMAFYGASSGTVMLCTLCGNDAPSGGAFVSRGGSQVTAENTIVAFHTGSTVAYCTDSSSVGLVCGDVYGNQNGDWVGCFSGQSGVNGNFSADPLFCDVGSLDFTLDANSPCVNAPGCGQVGAFGEGCSSGSDVTGRLAGGEASFGFVGSWPNPVHREAHLSFSLSEAGRATLEVFDTSGRRVAVLADRRFEAGISSVTWDGRDGAGRQVASGVYFCRLEVGERVATRKVVLVTQ